MVRGFLGLELVIGYISIVFRGRMTGSRAQLDKRGGKIGRDLSLQWSKILMVVGLR